MTGLSYHEDRHVLIALPRLRIPPVLRYPAACLSSSSSPTPWQTYPQWEILLGPAHDPLLGQRSLTMAGSGVHYTPPPSPPSPTASFYDVSDDEEDDYNTIAHSESGKGVKLLFSKSKVLLFWLTLLVLSNW